MKNNYFIILIIGLFLIPLGLFPIDTQTAMVIKANPILESFYDITAVTNQTFEITSTVTCFSGPDSAFKVINDSLYNAKTSFYLEVYTLSSEALVNGLIAADSRGVDVQVLLSEDRVSGYEDDYTNESAYRLDQAGIPVSWASSSYAYTHAKFWIVDSKVAFIYSGNWAPSSIPVSPDARENREMGVAIHNVDVANYYENIFLEDLANGNPYVTGDHIGYLQDEETGTYEHPFTEENVTGSMKVTPFFSPENSFYQISQLINSAEVTIDLELQYIYQTCDLLPVLLAAASRGVVIQVLINKPGSSSENVTQTLLENGIKIRFFKGLGHNHNKYINVDGEIVSISSTNWSDNSLFNNRESGANIENVNIASYFDEIFDYDWAKGEIPTGYLEPVTIIAPIPSEVIEGTYQFKANFAVNTYTSGELYIDTSLAHTWTNPADLQSVNIDTTDYTNGIHTIKVIGTPTVGSPITVQEKVNFIQSSVEWALFISEVRYDAESEPEGEFIEVFNGFEFDIAIGNWYLTDNEDDFKFPEGTIFGDMEIFLLVRDPATFASEMAGLGITGITSDYTYADIQLGNTGEDLILKDIEGNIIDAVIWGSATLAGHVAWTGSMDPNKTLQRDPANHDTNDCSVDFVAETPNPGTVYITVAPTGFIPGYILTTTLFAISFLILLLKVCRKRKN